MNKMLDAFHATTKPCECEECKMSDDMNNPEDILEYCNEATSAPWVGRLDGWTIRAYPNNEIAKHGFKVATTCSMVEDGQGQIPSVKEQVANQQFITKARTDLPAMAQQVIALRKNNESLEAELKEYRGLLSVANCPNCDGSGAYYDNMGEVCQCQWCYETKKALNQDKTSLEGE